MKEQFIQKRFSKTSDLIITHANLILNEYAAQGFDLSLRQLYYQFVARGLLENSQRSYKNLGNVIADARLAGLIDWDYIKDRGRNVEESAHWNDPAQILDVAARQFQIDKWSTQDYWVWVMVEKQALEGVMIPVCQALDIPFIANKGYSSASTMYEIGKRMGADDRQSVVLYLGDHDPSGIDMTRDVGERLRLFSQVPIEVERIALNMDQIEKYKPPRNPAKQTDSRYSDYVNAYGDDSWELDALDPTVLSNLIRGHVTEYLDEDRWAEKQNEEQEMRDQLKAYATTYRKRHGQ